MTLPPECTFAWDGIALGILLGAIPVAIALTLATLYLYRRAIGQAMRAAARDAVPLVPSTAAATASLPLHVEVVPSQVSTSGSIAAEPTREWHASRAAQRRLSVAYSIAGAVHAALNVAIMFVLNDIGFAPFRALAVWSVFAWPIIAVLMMTSVATRRRKWQLAGAYFAWLLVLESVAEALELRYESNPGELFLLWGLLMGPPTLIIVSLANRAWRAVGLIALTIAIAFVGALMFGFQLLGCAALALRSGFLLDAFPYLMLLIAVSMCLPAWLVLRNAARRYRAKLRSDEMLVVNSWWLVVTALEVLFEMGSSGWRSFWFLLAYAGYAAALHVSLRWVHRAKDVRTPQSMLLLRVFGHDKRVRTLADQIGQTWRHTGSINMIGGTDLATALIEPDELMAFLSRRLRQSFISSPEGLDSRMQTLDELPDPDGRYRVNEFFCHDNTWRATVRALAARSAVVLMDLRGFGKQNRGCEFELDMLLSEVPLSRVVLVVDRSTRIEDLQSMLRSVWERTPASSPNRRLTSPALSLFEVPDSDKALSPLLSRIYAAAQTVRVDDLQIPLDELAPPPTYAT